MITNTKIKSHCECGRACRLIVSVRMSSNVLYSTLADFQGIFIEFLDVLTTAP